MGLKLVRESILKSKNAEEVKKSFNQADIANKLDALAKGIRSVFGTNYVVIIQAEPARDKCITKVRINTKYYDYSENVRRMKRKLKNDFYIAMNKDYTNIQILYKDKLEKEFAELSYETYKEIVKYFKNVADSLKDHDEHSKAKNRKRN